MKRNNARSILRELKPTLVQQFGVNQLALFDFTARDDARDNSDVDILVGFDGPAISTRYFGVQLYLEDQPGCPIDLVTDRTLQPELCPFIEKAAIND
jgi:predicted nucleotidyltransferase